MNSQITASDPKKNTSAAAVINEATKAGSGVGYEDTRPQAVAHRAIQEMANNSAQVKQMKSMQEMIDNNPHVQQLAAIQRQVNSVKLNENSTVQLMLSPESLPDDEVKAKFQEWLRVTENTQNVMSNEPTRHVVKDKYTSFYWSNSVNIGGKKYELGVNIHTDTNEGLLGSVWLTGVRDFAVNPNDNPVSDIMLNRMRVLQARLSNTAPDGRSDLSNMVRPTLLSGQPGSWAAGRNNTANAAQSASVASAGSGASAEASTDTTTSQTTNRTNTTDDQ